MARQSWLSHFIDSTLLSCLHLWRLSSTVLHVRRMPYVIANAKAKLERTTQSIIQSNYFIVRPKVDQRAGLLSLPHWGIIKTEKIELKHKTDEQIHPVNGLQPWDQSDRQKQTKVQDEIFWKDRSWARSQTVRKWWKVRAVCSKLNRHVQIKVAEKEMNNLHEESWVM